jgi:multiple sugar transport system substrate-binding protein
MRRILSLVLTGILALSIVSFAAAEETVDLGGITITFGNWGELHEELRDPDSRESLWRAELEAKYNFKFAYDYLPGDEGTPNTFLSSVLSGTPFADVCNLMSDAVSSFARQGLLYPLNTLESYDLVNGFGVNQDARKTATMPDGSVYGVFFAGNYMYENQVFVAYNKTLAEKLGMPDLVELYKNGEWTFEKFIELAAQAHQDTTGDGAIDQFGFCYDTGSYGLSYAVATGVPTITADNKINWDDPKIMDAMRAMQTSMQYAVRAPSDANWDWHLTKLKAGDTLFCMTQYLWSLWSYRDMSDDFGLLPFPSPDGERYLTYTNAINYQVIPYNAKNPEAAAFVMGLLAQNRPWDYDDNGELIYDKNDAADFVENNWGADIRDDDVFDYLVYMFEDMELVIDRQRDYNIFWSANGFQSFVTGIQNGINTPEQAAEIYKLAAQAELDQILDD